METRFFSIGEAAKLVHTTTETLRHYDRIGLVKPGKVDEWSRYRYYTRQDMVRLQTVHALQQMDLSLREIKTVLEYDDLDQIIAFLEQAEQKADQKIAELQFSKEKIQLARADYESKRAGAEDTDDVFTCCFPQRAILLSDHMETPTLDNLWNYLHSFYEQLAPQERGSYSFEDLAGIYTRGENSRLFAVCTRYPDIQKLIILPAGRYLCANCSEENRAERQTALKRVLLEQYKTEPDFMVQQIVISGILQWKYQIQYFIKASEGE